ncbi:MAG: AMP-binding protein [Acidobacteria bacterium]|nr:AMP-binding protein [Acidobacteriota bacterium]
MPTEAWLIRAAYAEPQGKATGTLTYGQLLSEAQSAARRIAALGVARGDRVGLVIGPGEEFALALHGCLLLGTVAVPVDPSRPPAEREALVAGCSVVLDGLPDGHEDPAANPEGLHEPGDVAVVMHTSGSTGQPRAVELTYGNLWWSAAGSAVALGLDPAERWLCCLPVAHVGGLSVLTRSAIYATTALVHEGFDASAVLDELSSPEGPTMVSLVPTMLSRLLDAGLERPPALRWALLGGAPAPSSLLERAAQAGVPVAPTWGMTETASQVTTFGRPLFCTRVEASAGGELLVDGPTVSPSCPRPLATGDLGEVLPSGEVVVAGRASATIITGGENVDPVAVEHVLEEHPQVGECGVYGRPDREWGEAVVALVVPSAGEGPQPADLDAWCRERLAPFECPKEVRVVDSLPRTGAGKLDRARLGESDGA